MFPLFKKCLKPQVRTSKFVNSLVYQPRLWRLASGMHPINFLWLVYSTICAKFFSIYGVYIPRKCSDSMHSYSCPSSPLKTPGKTFWKSVSPKTKGMEETMVCSIKTQSENMKITWSISLIIFCLIYNFSKCHGLTVLWIISIK